MRIAGKAHAKLHFSFFWDMIIKMHDEAIKEGRTGLKQQQSVDEIRRNLHDFKSYEELRMTMGGWFHEDQNPPVMTPPLSTEWKK